MTRILHFHAAGCKTQSRLLTRTSLSGSIYPMSFSRRRFLKTASATSIAAPWIGWSSTSEGGAPSEELRFANFGGNGRAWSDLTEMLKAPNTSLVAVAEVDSARTNKVKESHPDVPIYADWRKLLDEKAKELDAVVIGTPDHVHAPIAISAMQLGLAVYCEKPLTRTLHECRVAQNLAAENKLATQMGNQLASGSGNRTAVKLLREGIVGKIISVHSMNPKSWGSMNPLPAPSEAVPESLDWDLWISVGRMREYIPREFHPSQWRKRIGYGTGTLGDMGCHIYHPWFMGLGHPETLSVISEGPAPVDGDSWPLNGLVKHQMKGTKESGGDFDFTWYDGNQKPGAEVAAALGVTDGPEGNANRIPKSGSVVIGESGALVIPHGGSGKPFLYRDGTPSDEPIEMVGNEHHHTNFADAIRGKISKPARCHFGYSGPMTEAVLLGTVAMQVPGEKLEWNSEKCRFRNSKKANDLLHEDYREGWEVKGV